MMVEVHEFRFWLMKCDGVKVSDKLINSAQRNNKEANFNLHSAIMSYQLQKPHSLHSSPMSKSQSATRFNALFR